MMTTEPSRSLLETLESLPASERADALRARSQDVDALLIALGDEAERLVVVEVARALATSKLVVSLCDEVGSAAPRARARRALGQALAYAGRFEDALAACREAATIADDADEPVQAARARLASIHALGELGRYPEAIEAGEGAWAALRRADEPALAARADINLGVIHRKRGESERALKHFNRARGPLASEPMILAQLESNRGEALLELDRLAEAEEAFLSSLRIFESASNKWGAAIVEGNLADLATRQGRYHAALYHFECARGHVERDQSPTHVARILLEQADVKRTIGMFLEAGRDYSEAIEILDHHDQPADIARGRVGLGRVLMQLDRFDAADEHLRAAAEMYREMGNTLATARVDLVRSELSLLRDRIDEAAQLAFAAREALAEHPIDRALAEFRLASIALRRGGSMEAHEHVAEALRRIEHLGIAPLEADLMVLRAEASRCAGEQRDALRDLESAVARLERVRGALQADRFRAAFLGDHMRGYELLASTWLDGDGDDGIARAFDVIERARGRSLLEAMSGVLTLGEAAPPDEDDENAASLHLRLGDARRRLNALYSRADRAAQPGLRSGDAAWKDEMHELEREIDALENRLAARRGVGDLYAEPAPLGDVQQTLDAGEVFIEYFDEGDDLSAIIIRRDGAAVARRIASRSAVSDAVRKVHFQIGRATRPGALDSPRAARLTDDCRNALGVLHTLVLKPLAEHVAAAARCIISPSGALHVAPFSALWDGERYLIERGEIVLTPSAAIYERLMRERPEPPQDEDCGALIVGVSDAHAPQIEEEVARLPDVLPGAKTLIGEAATADAVLQQLGQCAIAHLACHGRFDAASPLASGLRMHDRWVTVRDIYQLRLPGTFVALSGCETGVSELSRGNELVGLVRAFLAAGASTLAVSLWKVHDASTMRLMHRFYSNVREGAAEKRRLSHATSMREAQLATLRDQPHPALWAPFILVGKP